MASMSALVGKAWRSAHISASPPMFVEAVSKVPEPDCRAAGTSAYESDSPDAVGDIDRLPRARAALVSPRGPAIMGSEGLSHGWVRN